jgi:hypothetical protein
VLHFLRVWLWHQLLLPFGAGNTGVAFQAHFFMKNFIAIRRKLILIPSGAEDNVLLAATLQAELMALGYMLDEKTYNAATRAPQAWIIAYHDEILPALKKNLGADRAYQPIYKNFPIEVMQLDHVQLFLNAFCHYLSDGKWEPPQVLTERGVRFEKSNFTTIRLATEQEFLQIFTRLASLPQSLTESDKQALGWFADTYGNALRLPDTIPFKETLCILAAKGLDVPVKTATDVLRIAVHISGGDISLPAVPSPKVPLIDWAKTYPQWTKQGWWPSWAETYHARAIAARQEERALFKFKHFTRPQRRMILSLLERTSLDVAEMQLRLGRWLRLGEILHVGEYADRFPRTAKAFSRLRNQTKTSRVRTFPGRLYLAFASDTAAGMKLLATRPGEFARRLDWMLRTFDPAVVLDSFATIGPEVSSKVLLELFTHFAVRHLPDMPRTVMLKGKRARMKSLDPLPPMPHDLVARVGNSILSTCRSRIAKLPSLGAVWIDSRLKDVPIPTAMRSVNTSVKTYVRGTRIPFRSDAKVIRAFLHWFDEKGTEDLDLSVGLYTEDFKSAGHISFTQLKNDLLNCCHSGDVRHRQGSCAEYADIDPARCVANGVRYATVLAFNYDGRPMHTVKQCAFGLMEREHAEANEIFVPQTISNCMALANESTSVIVCIIDLKRHEYVWADLESDGFPTFETTKNKAAAVLRSLLLSPRFSVYDLLSLHTTARGTFAPATDSADISFHWQDFVTDYTRIASYMSF